MIRILFIPVFVIGIFCHLHFMNSEYTNIRISFSPLITVSSIKNSKNNPQQCDMMYFFNNTINQYIWANDH